MRTSPRPSIADLCVVDVPATHFARLPTLLTRGETTYTRKTEFHLTLLPRRLHVVDDGRLEEQLGELLEHFHEQHARTLYEGLVNAFYVLREDAVETIVQQLVCDAHGELRRACRDLGLTVPDPWPHVTVYISGGGRGIGVESPDELRQHRRSGPLDRVTLLSG